MQTRALGGAANETEAKEVGTGPSPLWLEQQHGFGTDPPSSHKRKRREPGMRPLVEQVAAVRDALYEFYCDATDPRLAPMVASGEVLEAYVSATYGWCEQVIALIVGATDRPPDTDPPSGEGANEPVCDVEASHPGSGDALRGAAAALGVDASDPVEPLRGFPRHLEQLFSAIATLHTSLAKAV